MQGTITQTRLPVVADFIARGDGSWIVRPVVPADAAPGETWVRVREAARFLRVSSREVYRMLGEYLVYRRPTRRRMEVRLDSLRALRRATDDPEFWDDARRLGEYRRQVGAEMAALVGDQAAPTRALGKNGDGCRAAESGLHR